MSTFEHHEINFGPLATNVLDCVGRNDLFTPDGRKVTIDRYGTTGFQIQVAGEAPRVIDNNLSASYYLNMREVGVHQIVQPEAQPVTRPTYEDLLARINNLGETLELTATQAGNALRRYDALSTLLEEYVGQSLSHNEKVLALKSLIATAHLAAAQEDQP